MSLTQRLSAGARRFRRIMLRPLLAQRSVSVAHFEKIYAETADPWRLASAENIYERDKYADTLALLPRSRYRKAVEIGCSVGVLTAQLGQRCDEVIGVDLSETALIAARANNHDQSHVSFARYHLPDDPPAGRFDLLIFSEVLYYFSIRDLRLVADWAAGATDAGADIVLVNYLGALDDYPLNGDRAVAVFLDALGLRVMPVQSARRANYRIDIVRRSSVSS